MELILLKKIDKNNKSFEEIKHIDENGVEFWYARELMSILEYNKWENFEKVINKAKSLNTTTVFRVFVLDSHALSRSIELIKRVEPDFVEVLPGVATKAIRIINEETNTAVIAGGLINSKEEVDIAVSNGAKYITTSDRSLW